MNFTKARNSKIELIELDLDYLKDYERAYEELEREGFIENFAGKGCFVKTQNTDFLREESIKQTEDLLFKACEKAKICGLSLDEMKEILDLIYGGNENE